jgi:hypothetical protein
LGSVRINTTAITAIAIGRTDTALPTRARMPESIHSPTGRAASNQELAAKITATANNAKEIPSRR